MRVGVLFFISQGILFLITLFCSSCYRPSEESPIVLPVTRPLSRSIIGYGVINVSYIQVVAEPSKAGLSLGYLRKGSIVEILERRFISSGGQTEAWVLVDGDSRGWLLEAVIQLHETEAQARTAAETMLP